MQGFSPIITTASPKHTAYLQSLGATHVLDRSLPSSDLRAALSTLTGGKQIQYVHDSFGRDREAQRLGFSALAPGGAFVTVNPRDHEHIADLVEESEKRGEGKRVARAFGSYEVPGNGKLGDEIFSRLTGWLESGAIVVSFFSPSNSVVGVGWPGMLISVRGSCSRTGSRYSQTGSLESTRVARGW